MSEDSEISTFRQAIAMLTTNVAVLTQATHSLEKAIEKMQADSVGKDAFDSMVARLAKVETTLSRVNWLIVGAVIAGIMSFLLHVNGATLP